MMKVKKTLLVSRMKTIWRRCDGGLGRRRRPGMVRPRRRDVSCVCEGVCWEAGLLEVQKRKALSGRWTDNLHLQ
jgi:hypothetical protein